MRPIHFALLLLALATTANAQELKLSEPAASNVCVGESLGFSLSATGDFGANNTFVLQSSSDGFKTFTNEGLLTPGAEKFIELSSPVSSLRFRAVASEPYTLGPSTTGLVRVWPRPGYPDLYIYPGKALLDQPISTKLAQASELQYKWSVQDGFVQDQNTSKPSITFTSAGKKLVEVVAVNGGDCADTSRREVTVYTCNAKIPKSAHIVTGQEKGSHDVVWIKAGGKYTSDYHYDGFPVIYMETGASLYTEEQPTVYAKPGASIKTEKTRGYVAILQNGGVSMEPADHAVLYTCPDMQFDYSEVQSSVDEEQLQSDLKMRMENGQLHLDVAGNFSAKLIDIMGRTMIDAQPMMETGSLDMRPLARGTYFVLITRGQTTIAKQIQR